MFGGVKGAPNGNSGKSNEKKKSKTRRPDLEVTERPKRERSAAKRLYWKMFISDI
jgi:hypothetical protein